MLTYIAGVTETDAADTLEHFYKQQTGFKVKIYTVHRPFPCIFKGPKPVKSFERKGAMHCYFLK